MKIIKTFVEWTGTLVGKLVLLALTIVLLGVLVVVGYYAYLDTHSAAAKQYLIEKYNLEDFDYMCTSYLEYTYSDISDCDNTSSAKLHPPFFLIEDKNGDFQDDYEKPEDGTIPSQNLPKIEN